MDITINYVAEIHVEKSGKFRIFKTTLSNYFLCIDEKMASTTFLLIVIFFELRND